jgi:uncharacterized protein
MKKILLLLLLPLSLLAQDLKTITHDRSSPVDDYANLYAPVQEQALKSLISKYWDTVQISLVTVPSFNGADPAEASVNLFNRWGIGTKSNNGLLVVIAKNDHKMFVCTGGGIQGELTDLTVVRLQKELATSRFKQGDYYTGTYDLLQAYIKVLSRNSVEYKEKAITAAKPDDNSYLWITLIGILIIGGIIYTVYRVNKYHDDQKAANLLQKHKEDAILAELAASQARQSRMSNYISKSYVAPPKPSKKSSSTNNFLAGAATGYIASRVIEDIKPKKKDDDYSSNYSSSNDSSSSSSSSSYDSGSSSSSFDFGGGSSDSGGGGSDW